MKKVKITVTPKELDHLIYGCYLRMQDVSTPVETVWELKRLVDKLEAVAGKVDV